jgi:hypothetical protein
VRTGGVEPPHAGRTGLQPAELAGALASARKRGDRPDSNRYREVHDLGCCRYTTATTTKSSGIDKRCLSGDDRTRTGGFSADNRVLLPLSYAPEGEMEWRGWDSNPRSRAHEAREDSHSSTALLCKQVWPAGVEPAVSGAQNRRGGRLPHSQTKRTPGGTRTRIPELRARCHRPSTTGASKLRRQGSNLRLAINSRASFPLDYTGTKRRQQDSNLRTCPTRLRVSNALPSAPRPCLQSGRGGTRTPKAAKPTRFRDGVPHPWQPFLDMAPAGVEPAPHRLRVGGSSS